MNVNHEYWHLRENDPVERTASAPPPDGASIVDIKFSFGNCLDNDNEIRPAPPFGYVPEITFGNLNWMDRLRDVRFPALAGWRKSNQQIFGTLNDVSDQIFAQFQNQGQPVNPDGRYGQGGKGFGYGTVHHAAGSLRMPYRTAYNRDFEQNSVVDEDLRVLGTNHLYVCDMSVMPFSSAANPVRTLVALALRLSRHFG
jgi:choline dehydrogenase-like flavoprotein